MFETSHEKLYFDNPFDGKISGTTLLQNQTSLFGLLTSGTLSTQTAKAVIAIKNCDPGNLDCEYLQCLGQEQGRGHEICCHQELSKNGFPFGIAIRRWIVNNEQEHGTREVSIRNCDLVTDCEYWSLSTTSIVIGLWIRIWLWILIWLWKELRQVTHQIMSTFSSFSESPKIIWFYCDTDCDSLNSRVAQVCILS